MQKWAMPIVLVLVVRMLGFTSIVTCFCPISRLVRPSMHHRGSPRSMKLCISLPKEQNLTQSTVESTEFSATWLGTQQVKNPVEVLATSNISFRNSTTWASFFSDLPPQSVLLLNVVAVLWGTQHAVIKRIVQDTDPGTFTLLRFGLAALLASPYTPGLSQRMRNNNSSSLATINTWRWGAEMGLWMVLGFSFQAIGLQFTTAQRSGFLLYLNVKFVPFFARIFLGREISLPTWVSAFAAFAGTALLAWDGGATFDLNTGDLWTIAAAAASAMFILRLERASAEVSDAAGLNAACLWVVTALAAVWTVTQSHLTLTDVDGQLNEIKQIVRTHGLELLYLSGVTSALANWIQTKAQRDVSAERASIIYAMDPVYGAFFANLLLGETLGGVAGWSGAALITIAAATNALMDFRKKE